MPKEITVHELKAKLDQKENFVFLDCREQDEFDYARIEGAQLIPISEFEQRAEKELNPQDEIVIYCHHGMRSMHACLYLENKGYTNTVNVQGGIEAWSLQVDPKIKRY